MVKLLFWEMLGVYNLMLIYGIFNFGWIKERALTKLDDVKAEGGEMELKNEVSTSKFVKGDDKV